MQIFIGHLIRNELRRQGHTNAWLAERIGLTPRALQKIYNKHSLDTRQLLRISLALHHDFFRHYSLQVNEKQEQAEDNPVEP